VERAFGFAAAAMTEKQFEASIARAIPGTAPPAKAGRRFLRLGGKIASIITAGAWAGARGNMEEHLEQSASGRKSRATRTWRKVPRMAGTP
jgi:hypothetical protein